ncbi:MAG: LytTR family DNA-binding domain-containing protein [Gemmatimonadota bacterium]|jgi:hypothetical protein
MPGAPSYGGRDVTPPSPPGSDARTTAVAGSHADGILRYLAVAGVALLALVMALEPDVGFAAPPAARLAFWSAEIGAGLCVLQSVLYVLTRVLGASRVPTWALVGVSGLIGAALLTPLYWLIGEGVMQQWLGYPALPDTDAPDRGGVAIGGMLLREFGDIVGPVSASWAMICLPRLHWLVPPLLQRSAPAVAFPRASDIGAEAAGTAATVPAVEGSGPTPIGTAMSVTLLRSGWRERLPREIGRDVIAVASELQYLRVWTPRGCALILGALADVEAEDAGVGLRVHRSWWVAARHVVSVRRTSSGATCMMSDGRRVPVSRRRRAEVLARFGDGARYIASAASEAVADASLNRKRVVGG